MFENRASRRLASRSVSLLGVALGALASSPAAALIGGWGADPRSSVVQRCEQALEQRIRSEHPHTDRVITLGGSLVEWPASRSSEAGIAGDGKMLRGQSWDDFEFTCWYGGRSGAVSRLEWSGPYQDGKPVRGAHRRQRFDPTPIDSREGSARACLDAVGAEIHRDHPRTGRLEALRGELGHWRRPNGETVVRGRGRFEGARGGWHEVSFQCGLEPRGRVANAWYQLD